jgi:hypothetical protein
VIARHDDCAPAFAPNTMDTKTITSNAMKRLWVAFLAAPALAVAQGATWNESWVGSEWEIYARALADRGVLGTEPWSARPFAPPTIRGWASSNGDFGPWKARLAAPSDHASAFSILRPSITSSYNSGFAWGMGDGPVWQGRGLNAWATAGLAWHAGILNARIEPLFELGQNRAFALEPTTKGSSPFVDDLRPTEIDLPQRFGNSSLHILDPGQSFIRLDYRGATLGFSTENIFWGPGVRQALLFDANAAGFPHAFIGTGHAIATPAGRFYAQLIYGRLEESRWAPANVSASRFGAGGIAVWMPPSQTIEIGVARFYHRQWPKGLSLSDLTVPFGSFVNDREVAGTGVAENQLLSVFATIRVPTAGFEVFGEFGKNDRNGNLRDALVEPEHNSAWLLGAFKVIGPQSLSNGFWTVRAEVASGRVSELQNIGRGQSTFYDHTTVTQGHTQAGQLLGSPLVDRSGGVDASVDRWSKNGRLGLSLFERQMPGDLAVGLPPTQARSQWDVAVNGTWFFGGSDLTFALGHVWDLDRLPKTDVGNTYIRLGLRAGLP